MTDKQRRLLSRQLSDQARLLETQDSGELAVSLAASCCELLKSVRNSDPGEDFEEVYYSYLQLSEEIEAFFSDAEKRLEDERNTSEYVQAQERLREARAKSEEARTARMQAEKMLKELGGQVEQERRRQEEAQEELAQLKEIFATLQDMKQDCSLEKIEEQKRNNDELLADYLQSRETLRQQEEALRQQEEANREIRRKIRAVESVIEQMPERQKDCVRTYQEKEAQLELLRQAETVCSPERQAEMQNEIDCLQPLVDQMRKDMETLKQLRATLQEQSTQYDSERHILSTNLLELWRQSIDSLRAASAEHEKALIEIDTETKTLKQKLADCEAMRQRYSFWLDAATTPLNAMIKVVGRPESEKLCKTLDAGRIKWVERLSEQIEGDLRELDDILSQCSRAVNEDQQILAGRAHERHV